MVKRTKNIGAVVFSYYPADPRVKREAEAFIEAGMNVDVICLQDQSEHRFEIVNGVHIHRLNIQRSRKGKINYILEYVVFILLAGIKLTQLHLKKRFEIIHIHNMPDILVFSSLLPKLAGAKVILDLHDPMPELFMTKYDMNTSDKFIRFLKFCERKSIRFADMVITPNIAFRDLFIERGCPEHKIHIVMNSPQNDIFSLPQNNKNVKKNGIFHLMYHGTVVERHGLDLALQAIASLRQNIPNIQFHVYGDGDDFIEKFTKLIHELELIQVVKYYGKVTLSTIARAIENIDVGLIPNRDTPFTAINFPTRIFEYLCYEKAVIAPKTKGILDYFDDNSLYLFEPGNHESLADNITKVYSDLTKRKRIIQNGVKIYQRYLWEKEKNYFVDVVNTLL